MPKDNNGLDKNMGGGPVKSPLESDNAFSRTGLKNDRLTREAVKGKNNRG
ncbi:hypothetical protein JOC77_003089 [Peribacillus deserti]|uniref:Small, acid-soluble spore protein L n=1 Tax=Peribacillus deserti TaxID=673318 RepID=A0ABS2QKW4_9BACI|nr:hypothetical protein [Peribacillus deserti]MBM7693645.1 hypothetical protein [Peribacillus deserti]